MPFNRPTLTDLIDRTLSDLISRLGLVAALPRRAFVKVIGRVLAGAAHMLYGRLEWISREAIPDTAVDWLPRWAAVWGVAQKQAQFASGDTILLTGTIDGTTVPAGSLLKRSDGAEYSVQADATLSGLAATASVIALVAGADGNAAVGSTLTFEFPISGVNSTATVGGDGITNGSDVELIDSWRARLIERIQQPPNGGSASDYVEWALAVPGVTRAWCYPLYLGAGTVGVTFVRDNDTPSIIPDSTEVEAVQDYIDERRPVTANCTVFAPIADVTNYTMSVVPNTAAVKTAVQAALADFHAREAIPGGTLYLSRINEAISGADGETNHVMTVPAADIVSAAGHIATLGTITWL